MSLTFGRREPNVLLIAPASTDAIASTGLFRASQAAVELKACLALLKTTFEPDSAI